MSNPTSKEQIYRAALELIQADRNENNQPARDRADLIGVAVLAIRHADRLPVETSGELAVGDEVEYVDDGDTGTIIGPDPEGRVVVRWKSGVISHPMLSKLRRAQKAAGES